MSIPPGDIAEWLAASRAGELGPQEEALLQAHLAGGPEASARLLSAALKQARHAAPAGLAARIRAEIARETPVRTAPLPFRAPRRWAMSALAAAACLLLAWNLSLQFQSPGVLTLADQVVDGHVRSLMASHLTDVVSSDQHTVKPWFNGKLDLAPPVGDFAAQGFTLVGGRLDYLVGHPVAALIYRHNEHLINLFILPETGADQPPAHLTQRGYALLTWRKAGLAYWAVSDINPPELDKLPPLVDTVAASQQSE